MDKTCQTFNFGEVKLKFLIGNFKLQLTKPMIDIVFHIYLILFNKYLVSYNQAPL